jgi:hypothetical protein
MSNGDFFKQYGPWPVIPGGARGVGPILADRFAKQGSKLLLGALYPMVRTPAMVGLGMDFDNALVKPHEPDEIADQLLANIRNDPCLHAGRSDALARALKLRSMERADAVRTMAGISASTDGHHTNR